MSVDLSVIIVNWNGINFLPNCIASLVRNPPSIDFETIVVDNDSSDASVEWLNSSEASLLMNGHKLRLIKSGSNLGFGKANNLAFRQTQSPFLLLLNPDTTVTAGSIDALLDAVKSEKTIGAVVPKLFYADGKLQHNVWGFPPTPLTFIVEGFKLYRFLPKALVSTWLYSSHWDYSQRREVPMFGAAAMLVRREMIDDIGGFDEDFFMFGEDGEWCVRMNRNGWRTFFEPDATMTHIGGQSSKQRWGVGVSKLREEEGFLLFQEKCVSRYLFFANVLTRLFIFAVYYLKCAINRDEDELLPKIMALQIRALFPRGKAGS